MEYLAKEYTNSGVAYAPLLSMLRTGGKKVDSRLGETRELSTAITLQRPLEMVPFPFGRRFNYFGMLAESLWLLSDVEEVDLIAPWNSQLRDFSDDGRILYGAYGPRIAAGPHGGPLEEVIDILKTDRMSRQAILSIWEWLDLGHDTKDLPCNVMVMFKVRGNDNPRLNMTVINRSNDIHWGLMGVNFPQFALLQNYVASRLQLALGVQTHISDSLHLYIESEPHRKITHSVAAADDRLNFFSWYPIGCDQNYSFDIMDPDWTHDEHGRTIRSVFEFCLSSERPTKRFGRGAFINTVVPLLSLYSEMRTTNMTRIHAIHELGRRVSASLEENDYYDLDIRHNRIPFEWILGAYYTLCTFAQEDKREEYARAAAKNFFALTGAFIGPDYFTQHQRRRISLFLRKG